MSSGMLRGCFKHWARIRILGRNSEQRIEAGDSFAIFFDIDIRVDLIRT